MRSQFVGLWIGACCKDGEPEDSVRTGRARASRWRRESPESGSTSCRGVVYTAATSLGPPFEGASTTREPFSYCAQITLRTWFTVRACKKLPSDHKLQARQVPRRLRFPFLSRRLLGVGLGGAAARSCLKALGGVGWVAVGPGGFWMACGVLPRGRCLTLRSEGLLPPNWGCDGALKCVIRKWLILVCSGSQPRK